MKQTLPHLFSGLLGGLLVLGGVYFFTPLPSLEPESSAMVVPVRNVQPAKGFTPPNFDFTKAARQAMPAVVHIKASGTASAEDASPRMDYPDFFGDLFSNPFRGDRPVQGAGSGVIYRPDGYIITNNHVVEFADDIEVTLTDNRQFKATLVGRDDKTDLAVIKIEGRNLPTLSLADSDESEIGEWVLAVGNPFDLTSTVTAGIVSAKGRSLELLPGRDAIETFIQTDAAVNPGNSGGALVTTEGQLLGINTAIATRTGVFQGYSFAIPINLARKIADDIIEFGSFQRAFLGVEIAEMNEELANQIGLDITQGVYVGNLVNGGSAQYAGVLEQDVIVEVDGRVVNTVPELQEIIGRAKVGETVNLTVNRKGEYIDIPVRLRSAPQDE